jgi:broad specificity polyphosphatase/5'/3'-nucleotidase SurE
MLRHATVAAILAAALTASPSSAASSKAKQETCKFGADSQHLKAPERAKFIKNCMANRDDPRGPASEPAAPK